MVLSQGDEGMTEAERDSGAPCGAPCSLKSAAPLTASADAVSTLFRQHHRLLVRYLTSRLGSELEAKEVAQEAFLRALRTELPEPGALRAYVFKIATHLAIDRLRHAQVRRRAEERADSWLEAAERGDANDPAQHWLATERVDQLLRLVAELPETCQRVIDLHRLQGLPQREVAGQLGVSARMVRRYLTYAMVYCHLRLEGLGADQVKARVSL